VAALYFTDPQSAPVRRLMRTLGSDANTYPFADGLVSAATVQMINELSRGAGADQVFVRKLAAIVVDQTQRVASGLTGQRLLPDRLQLGRLNKVLQWIGRNLGEQITNALLAGQAGLSESYFRHMFLKAMGMTPNRYIQQQRVERARDLLTNTNLPIAHVAAECGFASQSYLTTCFKGAYAMTPARFRRNAGRDARG
jgi:AraC family transcriptional regulator